MTEKRFKYNVNTDAIEKDGDFFAYLNVVNAHRIVNLLNSLVGENEQLKVENGEMKDYLGRLEEINEQLKEKIKALEDANNGLVETIAHFDIEEVMR